jgi:aspartate racemase
MVRARLGGLRSARCLMWSFDFGEIEALQRAEEWERATSLMIGAAHRLEWGGADFFLIALTPAEEIARAVRIPLLPIVDPTAERIKARGIGRPGLLGTRIHHGARILQAVGFSLDILVPDAHDRALVHRVIYDELVQGQLQPASREAYRNVVVRLVARGAEGLILGCTEIMLLVRPDDSTVPLFDTTSIHAEACRRANPFDRSIGIDELHYIRSKRLLSDEW